MELAQKIVVGFFITVCALFSVLLVVENEIAAGITAAIAGIIGTSFLIRTYPHQNKLITPAELIREYCACGGSVVGAVPAAGGTSAFRRTFWAAHAGRNHEKVDYKHRTEVDQR